MAERIAILGAGAVGGYLGGLWRHAGVDVVLIGRPRVAAAVAAQGMRLTGQAGGAILLAPERIAVATDARALADATLVVVAVKSAATAEAAAAIAAHAPAAVPVLTLQNGIANRDILAAHLPGRAVLRGSVTFNVAHDGARWHKATAGVLAVERHPATQALAARLAGRPGCPVLRDDMLAFAWGKLLLNLNNAVNALSGKPLRAELSARGYRRVLAASIAEALAVLEVAGIRPAKVGPLPPGLLAPFVRLPDALFNTVGLRLQKVDPAARSSMADDFAAGRASEIERLNGEIVALAERHGRDAPVNRRIVALVRAAEAGGRRAWSAAELERAVLG